MASGRPNFLPLMDEEYDLKPNVCRNLFGPVNHHLCHDFLKRQLSILMDNSSKNWNFDFANDLPREGGRYVWEAVSRSNENATEDMLQPTHVINFEDSNPGAAACRNPKAESQSENNCQKKRYLVQSSLKRFLPVRKRSAEKLRTDAYKKLTSHSGPKEAPSCYIHRHRSSCRRQQLKSSSDESN